VLTNSRYFCRLSKKRKLRCGLSAPGLAAGRVAIGLATMLGAATRSRSITGTRRLALGPRFSAMKARMRSSVSVVMRPPLRRRLASLPSFTARRPNVDSASPVSRQKSEISLRIASFMGRAFLVRLASRLSTPTLFSRTAASEPTVRKSVNHKTSHRCNGPS
jgi:hypothetical protein